MIRTQTGLHEDAHQAILETNAKASDLRVGDRFTYVVLSSNRDYLQHAICTRPGFLKRDGEMDELEIKNPSAPVRIQNLAF